MLPIENTTLAEGALSNKKTHCLLKTPFGLGKLGFLETLENPKADFHLKKAPTYIQWLRRNFQLGEVSFAAGLQLIDATTVALGAVVFRG